MMMATSKSRLDNLVAKDCCLGAVESDVQDLAVSLGGSGRMCKNPPQPNSTVLAVLGQASQDGAQARTVDPETLVTVRRPLTTARQSAQRTRTQAASERAHGALSAVPLLALGETEKSVHSG